MTSGLRTSARRGGSREGFTFLEIMLVIAVIAIIFVGTAPFVANSMKERRLRADADSIADMMREQRAQARESGNRRLIEIRSGGFYEKGGRQHMVGPVPGDAIFSVRFPGGEWEKPDRQVIEFSSMGLVTPISVRLENGKDWIELDFDLLTGRVGEERYAF